ncbi:hypothetical protein, partial [Streptococcus pseudopneumoniae]|uniref:hypothetical protein n=1 Tax=Streptococcus pseudopneumoniae TaxID=257758 RepID=UPI0019D688F5
IALDQAPRSFGRALRHEGVHVRRWKMRRHRGRARPSDDPPRAVQCDTDLIQEPVETIHGVVFGRRDAWS